MAPAKRSLADFVSPERQKLTAMQTQRLASLANVDAGELEGLTIAQASERLKWVIDPQWFWFREICGKVVRPDPISGVDYPVPYATVNVQDTECDLLTYFPLRSPWTWHFPLFCRRETIATVQTDACGNFCVWVPRFEIEWILRWRELRLCYPVIFNRPTLKDLIPPLRETPVRVPGHPDPGPLHALTTLSPSMVEAIAGKAAGALAEKVVRLQASQSVGAPNLLSANLLNRRAFATELPPPLPAEFHQAMAGRVIGAEGASAKDGVRAAIGLKLGLGANDAAIANFHPGRYFGPFWRCVDVFVPEWQRIIDVPDISFEVTQDINGDGVQHIIYDDPFGTDWTTNNVTLIASPIAKATYACGAPEVQCGDAPAILFAGEMPLDNPAYFNELTGYVVRVNRPANGDGSTPPVASDLSRPAAQTPFCETVQLFGCVNVEVDGVAAQYYRVLQSFKGGAYTTITGLAWNIFTFPGGVPVAISADTDGWYEVIPDPDDYHPARMVLEWPTPTLGDYTLKIEVADGSKNPIGQSAPVPIQVDNTAPSITFQELSWKFADAPDSSLVSLLGQPCPVIHRGATPRAIEVVFAVNVMGNHLRDSAIGVSGCGGGSFDPIVPPAPGTETYHWHTSPGDNSVLLNGRYTLAATALDGCYSFNSGANSRSMNPSGADHGNLIPPDWYEDVSYIWANPSISVAVVSEN